MGNSLEVQFGKMGARVCVQEREPSRERWTRFETGPSSRVRLDIARDRRGEYYDVQADPRKVSLEVIDVRPGQRHLLLMARDLADGTKEKFLCGHDERSWFVAAVPGSSVSSVATAFEALKPVEVRSEQSRKHVRGKDRIRRRTAAYVRQGEWFFVPAPSLDPPEAWIHRNEPLRRGAGKPHWAEYCVRTGGRTVYVSARYPNGLPEKAYRDLIQRDASARRWRWQVMTRDAGVFVRGRIRHPDHQTICLSGWHRVLPNTETQAPAMRHVAFLD